MLNLALSNYLRLLKSLEREEGQDLIEYGLILFLIAIAAVVSIGLAGDAIADYWAQIVVALTGL